MKVMRAYNSYEGIQVLGDMWTLTKGARRAVCTLSTHPLGWDLLVRVDCELVQSKVCRTEGSVLDTGEMWRKAFEAKGWA